MARLARTLLLALVSVLSLAQVSSELITPDIKRVGSRLACLCGSCRNSVGDCAMLGCGYATPAREKIRDMLAAGASDDAIVQSFVDERGIQALVTPPAEGFNLLTWIMPIAAIGFGLLMVWWFINRMSKPTPAPAIDERVLDKYRDTIEKDLAKLD
jgi:cytochrome c-type biogenesis protein CcmH/NrfF